LRHSRLAEFADGAQFVGPVAENMSLTDETRSKRRNGAMRFAYCALRRD